MPLGELIAILMALALGATGTVFSVVSFLKQLRTPDLSEINKRVSDLNLELTDLADRTQHWMRRQAVRNTREKPEGGTGIVEGAVSIADRKAALRRRITGGVNQ